MLGIENLGINEEVFNFEKGLHILGLHLIISSNVTFIPNLKQTYPLIQLTWITNAIHVNSKLCRKPMLVMDETSLIL